MNMEIMKVFRGKYEAALKDKHRLDLLEQLYSSGNNKAWEDFMLEVAAHGFRRALDYHG